MALGQTGKLAPHTQTSHTDCTQCVRHSECDILDLIFKPPRRFFMRFSEHFEMIKRKRKSKGKMEPRLSSSYTARH